MIEMYFRLFLILVEHMAKATLLVHLVPTRWAPYWPLLVINGVKTPINGLINE